MRWLRPVRVTEITSNRKRPKLASREASFGSGSSSGRKRWWSFYQFLKDWIIEPTKCNPETQKEKKDYLSCSLEWKEWSFEETEQNKNETDNKSTTKRGRKVARQFCWLRKLFALHTSFYIFNWRIFNFI